jgi:hypothetical protein
MEVSEAQRRKSLEDENRRLKHLLADLKPGQGSAESGDGKKRLGLAAQRQDVRFAVMTFSISERRACGLERVRKNSARLSTLNGHPSRQNLYSERNVLRAF